MSLEIIKNDDDYLIEREERRMGFDLDDEELEATRKMNKTDEIEVGEYGRTNLGKIIKFAWLQDENGIREKNKVILVDLMLTETRPYYYFKKDEFIVKHSKNIIDLIEEGDYVNGVRVLDITGDYIHTAEWDCYKGRLQNKLKSIVTKEQFKSIKYEVTNE